MARIQLAVGDRDDDFAAHHLTLDMGIGIVFAGVVVTVLVDGFMRHEPFEEVVVVFSSPGSSSLMDTLALMCIGLTRQRPFLTPLFLRAASTCGVMLI